jgi:hypothetical protein
VNHAAASRDRLYQKHATGWITFDLARFVFQALPTFNGKNLTQSGQAAKID